MNSINSLTTIGTLEFTDMMAKFGLNRSTCVYKNKYMKNKNTSNIGILPKAIETTDTVNNKLSIIKA